MKTIEFKASKILKVRNVFIVSKNSGLDITIDQPHQVILVNKPSDFAIIPLKQEIDFKPDFKL